MHTNNGSTRVTNDHVNFVTIGSAEISDNRHKVFDVVGESTLSPLATALVISAAGLEFSGTGKTA